MLYRILHDKMPLSGDLHLAGLVVDCGLTDSVMAESMAGVAQTDHSPGVDWGDTSSHHWDSHVGGLDVLLAHLPGY